MGAALGQCLFPHSPLCQGLTILGSIEPDLVLVPKFAIDKLRGRQPFATQSSKLMLLKELSHSLPINTLLLIVGLAMGWTAIEAFFVGTGVHILVDALTHCGIEYRDTDQSCVWPFQNRLSKLGAMIGIWEYRYAPGVLIPKPAEAVILTVMIAIILFRHFV